jgi:hypothetical protein
MLIDMHVRAIADDGTPRDAARTLEQAAKAGLDGILVVGTAEQLERGGWPTAGQQGPGPRVFVAVPVSTDRSDFLCVPRSADPTIVPAEWNRADRRQTPDEATVLARLNDHHAAVISVQPYVRRPKHPPAGDLVFSFEGIHAVEVRTADTDPMDADMAMEAGLGMRLPCLAGSGDRRGEPRLGELATLFAARIGSQAELVAALKSGDAWPVVIQRPQGSEGGRGGEGRKRRRRRGRGPRGADDGAPTSGNGEGPGDDGDDGGDDGDE